MTSHRHAALLLPLQLILYILPRTALGLDLPSIPNYFDNQQSNDEKNSLAPRRRG